MTTSRTLGPRIRPGRLVLNVVLGLGSLAMAYPLVFGIAASFVTVEDYAKATWLPIPSHPYFGNYAALLNTPAMVIGWVVNTLLRVAWYIVVPGVIAVLCGYVFGRLRFPGRNLVFTMLLSTMMFPAIVFLIPTYVIFARWPLAGGNDLLGQGGHGFVNSWPSLLAGGLVNAFYVFLVRQTISGIPRDFEDAARVDGAGTIRVLWHVYLPMLRPVLAVMAIFQAVAIWNDYLWPLIVVGGNNSLWTVGLGFQRLIADSSSMKGVSTSGSTIFDAPFAFTLANLAMLPPIILFLVLQRYFVKGMQGFSLKG